MKCRFASFRFARILSSRRRAALASGTVALLALSLVSCNNDEAVTPAYRQDLADLLTDHAGRTRAIVTDAGDTLRLTAGTVRTGFTPDSIYRIQALYISHPPEAELVDLATVLAPLPVHFTAAAMHRDPLRLEAVWRGGRYLNVAVSVLTGGGRHVFGFNNAGTTTDATGRRMLHLQLFHDQLADPLYYSRQVTLCCPLRTAGLREGIDSVALSVVTFGGTIERRFAY